jgi:carboxymethylenebutenolidase
MNALVRFRSLAPLTALLALGTLSLATGCAGPADDSASEAATGSESPAAAPSESRIPVSPTAQGQLPAAIVGEAPPPMGQAVHYVEEDAATTGYLAIPEGEGPFPSVILIHEWNGLVDRIRQTADALAAEGYVALAADLYQGRTGSNRDENMALMGETQADPDAIIANLDAAAAFLRARPDVTGKIATMGWCYGGGVAMSYAIGGENHEGTAIFYGRLVTDPEVLASLDHEIYGTFAALDQGPPPEQVDAFVEALRAAGIPNDVHIYDDVNHGFWLHVDQSPENRTEPARDAWERLKAYLGRVLGD